MSDDKSLVILKFAVKFMGVLLVILAMTLITAGIIKFKQHQEAKELHAKQVHKSQLCETATDTLEIPGTLIAASTSKGTVTATVLTADQQKIIMVFDACSGTVIQSFAIDEQR